MFIVGQTTDINEKTETQLRLQNSILKNIICTSTHVKEFNKKYFECLKGNPFDGCSNNEKGVDLNRNYDIQWMNAGTSSWPCASTYGPDIIN